jgi:hypothetical protein
LLSAHEKAGYFYGYSVFRQERDDTAKRCFGQKALVLISQHDFPNLFLRLISLMTSVNVVGSPTTLESACNAIAGWGNLTLSQQEVVFLHTVLRLNL